MAIRLSDAGITRFQTKIGFGLQVSQSEFFDLLTEIIDPQGGELTASLKKMSREEQLNTLGPKLSDEERADVKLLLDETGMQFAPSARNFLEALIGRAKLKPVLPLELDEASSAAISGLSTPGAIIEAANLSSGAAVVGRRIVDTLEVGTSDAKGRFSISVPDAQTGDQIRLRARSADGSVSDWFTTHIADGNKPDLRAAFVDPKRMVARNPGQGPIQIFNASIELPVSEPFAKLQFSNARTGEKLVTQLDEKGHLAEGIKLNAVAGDTLTVSVSDGAGNTDFMAPAGKITVPPAIFGDILDPGQADGPKLMLSPAQGKLFAGGIGVNDAVQGATLGDCYLPAVSAALANVNSDLVRDLIRENDDGTYSVRFFDRATMQPVFIVVDSDVYGKTGKAYGGSADRNENWFAFVEKAYATWKGGYQAITSGGADQLLEEVLGRRVDVLWLNQSNPDQAWEKLQQGVREGRPMVGGTYNATLANIYTNTGLHANHAYTVMGIEKVGNERMVKLRNPWGGTGFSGEFSIPVEKFAALMQALNVG